MKCKFSDNHKDIALLVFRIFFGALFFMHGISKFMKGTPSGLMLVGGIVEIVVGLAVILGIFTMIASFLGAGQMLVAYVMFHASKGFLPSANGGELALLYLIAFLTLGVLGAGKLSLDAVIWKNK